MIVTRARASFQEEGSAAWLPGLGSINGGNGNRSGVRRETPGAERGLRADLTRELRAKAMSSPQEPGRLEEGDRGFKKVGFSCSLISLGHPLKKALC